ncbi:hypothetical protein K438DRAFT_460511 [Mycena galopus ATCC 62051]|nr:hypothetical protein K438DRAFT_460511 [Mycena galopus ATCC 62051]
MLRLRRIFHSSPPDDWITALIIVARGLVSCGNCVPIPYIATALSAGLALLELIQAVGKTTDDLKYLAESVVRIMKLLGEEFEAHPGTLNAQLENVCLELDRHLTRIFKDIAAMSKDWSSSKFSKYMKVNCVRNEITNLSRRVYDLRADATLQAAIGTRMDLGGLKNVVLQIQNDVGRVSSRIMPTDPGGELVHLTENFHALKVGDVQLDFATARPATYTSVDGQRAELLITDYKGYVKGSRHTIRVYRGPDSAATWKDFLLFLAENSPSPGIPQLFGFCDSPKLQYLVFHGGQLCRSYLV